MSRYIFFSITLIVPMVMLISTAVWAAEPIPTYLPTVEDRIVHGNELELAGKIIITIDDCSLPEDAAAMFATLESRGLKATWFCNTRYLTNQDAQFWRRVYSAGHEFGYHTQNHTAPSELTYDELEADFQAYQAILRNILDDQGYEIKFIRPPFGDWNQTWLNWAADHDRYTTRWNIVVPNAEVTRDYIQAVIAHPEGGPIFLLHTRPSDAAWLDNNLDFLISLVGEGTADTFPTLSHAFGAG